MTNPSDYTVREDGVLFRHKSVDLDAFTREHYNSWSTDGMNWSEWKLYHISSVGPPAATGEK